MAQEREIDVQASAGRGASAWHGSGDVASAILASEVAAESDGAALALLTPLTRKE